MEVEGFSIYPNPAKDGLNIKLNNYQNRINKIELYDYTGKLVFTKEDLNADNYFVPFVGLSNGIYLCQVYGSGNQVMTSKLIVEY